MIRSYPSEPAGIYIHIPFCIRKCGYCDFYSISDLSLKDDFMKALIREMDMTRQASLHYDTLYIGGGTPSIFDAEDIRQVIEAVYRFYDVSASAEITIEVNPGTVTFQKLKEYYCAGINRINIGIQSFQDSHLKFLGRIHTSQEAYQSIDWARAAGFQNLGLDLIYGIPGQSKQSWLLDLQHAVDLMPEHLSCYMLSYEAGTIMDKNRQKGDFIPMPERLVSNLFEMTIEFLEDHRYSQYEISNFARSKSVRSRHNQKYWACVPYLGFGPSAHSFIEPRRYWNHRSVKAYLQDINDGKLPISEEEILTREQEIIEAIYLGLRKTEGIDVKDFEKKFGICFNTLFGKTIEHLEQKELVHMNRDCFALSRKGMLLLDSITSLLVSHEF